MDHNQPTKEQVESGTIRVGIDPPPDHIFKYRRNRQAPATEVWGEGTVTYIPQRAEYIDGQGNFVYYLGVDLPSKTVAPIEAIYAVAGLKRFIINAVRIFGSEAKWFAIPLVLMGKKRRAKIMTKGCDYINTMADVTVAAFYLEAGYYCKLVKELRKFFETLFLGLGIKEESAKKCAEIIGMFFEYDNAYRTRVQDLFGETTKEALLVNLPKELDRLLAIEASRETNGNGGEMVTHRFKNAVYVVKYLWMIPSARRALRDAVNAISIENCRMDEADFFHNLLYGDYNSQGKTLDERLKTYGDIYGADSSKWPPRIMIRNKTS